MMSFFSEKNVSAPMCFGDLTLLIEMTPGQEANTAFVKIIFGVKLCHILCVKTDLNNLMYPGYFFLPIRKSICLLTLSIPVPIC